MVGGLTDLFIFKDRLIRLWGLTVERETVGSITPVSKRDPFAAELILNLPREDYSFR